MKYLFKFPLKYLYNDYFFENKNNRRLPVINNWIIKNKSINERMNDLSKDNHYELFIKYAKQNQLSYNEEEIISWMDSLKIMSKISSKIIINEEITIITELVIPFTNRRPDYLLINKNKILIIEFSYSQTESEEYRYRNKLNQVIQYKELLENVLSNEIKIFTYTFIIKPDDKDKNVNNTEIENLCNYISYVLKHEPDAIEQLENL